MSTNTVILDDNQPIPVVRPTLDLLPEKVSPLVLAVEHACLHVPYFHLTQEFVRGGGKDPHLYTQINEIEDEIDRIDGSTIRS